MTAITLPLKRFPGQTMDREIYFGGLKTAQPLVLTISIPFALYTLTISNSSSPAWLMIFSLMPLIWALISHVYYVVKAQRSGNTLLDASLVELKQLINMERAYFNRVTILGVFITIASLGVALNRFYSVGEISVLSTSVVSALAFQMYIGSVVKGLFSTMDILKYGGLTLLLEASALPLLHIDYKLVLLILALSMIQLAMSKRALRNLGLNNFLQKTVR